MRLRLTSVVMVCMVALAAGNVSAEDTKKKEQPTPASKQEQAKKAAAEKAAAEKAAAEKAAAEAAKDGATPADAKAAVNTLEDMFAAYGITNWGAQASAGTVDVAEAIVWKEQPAVAAPAKVVPARAVAKQ